MCLGIPGQIVALSDDEPDHAIVEVSGVKRKVNITCVVDETQPREKCLGKWVLLHVGFAMSLIDSEEARKTLELLEKLGELDNELAQMQEQSGSEGVLQ